MAKFNLFDFSKQQTPSLGATFAPLSSMVNRPQYNTVGGTQPAIATKGFVNPKYTPPEPVGIPKPTSTFVNNFIPQANAAGEYDDIDLQNLKKLRSLGVDDNTTMQLVDEKKKQRITETKSPTMDWQSQFGGGFVEATANMLGNVSDFGTNYIGNPLTNLANKGLSAVGLPTIPKTEDTSFGEKFKQNVIEFGKPSGYETESLPAKAGGAAAILTSMLVGPSGTPTLKGASKLPVVGGLIEKVAPTVEKVAENFPKVAKFIDVYARSLPSMAQFDVTTRGKVDEDTLIYNAMAPVFEMSRSLPVIRNLIGKSEILNAESTKTIQKKIESLLERQTKLVSEVFKPGEYEKNVAKIGEYITKSPTYKALEQNVLSAKKEVGTIIEQAIKSADKSVTPAADDKLSTIAYHIYDDISKNTFGAQDLFKYFGKEAEQRASKLLEEAIYGNGMKTSSKQNLKLLLDDMYDIYKKSGDPKHSSMSRVLDEARKYIRNSVEEDVSKIGVDISEINKAYDGLRDASSISADNVRKVLNSEVPAGKLRSILMRLHWFGNLFKKPGVATEAMLEKGLAGKTSEIAKITNELNKAKDFVKKSTSVSTALKTATAAYKKYSNQ